MLKVSQIFAKMEGYGIAGKIPTIRNNPGDLRHSPHSSHPGNPEDIGFIDTKAHGEEDLDRQMRIYATRGLTIQQVVDIYAPPSENNTDNYLAFVCMNLGLTPQDYFRKAVALG